MKTTTLAVIISTVVLVLPHCLLAVDNGDTVTISKAALQKLIQGEVQRALKNERQKELSAQPKKSSGSDSASAPPAQAKAAPPVNATLSSTASISSSSTVREADSSGLFSVPNSPAASALNMNPDTMPRATLPKEIGLSNLNGLDLRGNPQTGLALDVSVGQLFMLRHKSTSDPDAMTVKDYSDNYPLRLAMRTQFSLAETHGTSSEDKSLKIAGGVMIPLLVAHDPVQIAGDKAANSKDGGKTTEFTTNRLFQVLDSDSLQSRFNVPIFGSLARTLYTHSDLAVGAYTLGASEDGSGTNFKYGGSAVYGTWDFSVHKDFPAVFVTNVTYRNHQLVPASAVSFAGSSDLVPEDSLLLGAGIQFGNKTINATAFWAWIKEWDSNDKSGYSNRYGVLAEYHLPNNFLGPNAFITLSAGEEIGGGDRPSNSFVLGGVKIGLGGDDFKSIAGN